MKNLIPLWLLAATLLGSNCQNSTTQDTAQAAAQSAAPTNAHCTNGTNVRLRKSPSVQADILETIPLAGEKVVLTGKKTDQPETLSKDMTDVWYQARYHDKTGWVFGAFIMPYTANSDKASNSFFFNGKEGVEYVAESTLLAALGHPDSTHIDKPESDNEDRWDKSLFFQGGTFVNGTSFEATSAADITSFELLHLNLEAYPKAFIQHPDITLRFGTSETDFLKVFKGLEPSEEGDKKTYSVPMTIGEFSDHMSFTFQSGRLVACGYGRDYCLE